MRLAKESTVASLKTVTAVIARRLSRDYLVQNANEDRERLETGRTEVRPLFIVSVAKPPTFRTEDRRLDQRRVYQVPQYYHFHVDKSNRHSRSEKLRTADPVTLVTQSYEVAI